MRRFLQSIGLLTVLMMPFVGTTAQAAIDNSPDNDSVAIIRGGVFSEQQLRQKAAQNDVPKVYAAFGINQNELTGMVDGVVYRDGRVTVGNNQVVARNAVTAGRWDNPKPGMTRIAGTDRAYKMSTSNFVDEGQTAFIKMVNGRFSFAVIKPCGNPVTATPVAPPTPGLTITKDVATIQSSRWQQSVTVKPGEAVKYRVTIKNTGKTTLDKLSLRDAFPGGITQALGTIQMNSSYITNNLTSGFTLPSLRSGEQHTIIYAAVTSSTEQRRVACTTGLTNTATVGSGGILPDRSDTAVVKVCTPVVPQSLYSCDGLQYSVIDRASRKVQFNARHTATNATFKQYVFEYGDGVREVSTAGTREHQYSSDGPFTAKVTAVFTVQGVEKSVSGDSCAASVSFTTPPQTPQPEQPSKGLPEQLVDTGPGAIIGAAFSTLIGGTVAFKYVWLRRFM